jgi:hypothetical protein
MLVLQPRTIIVMAGEPGVKVGDGGKVAESVGRNVSVAIIAGVNVVMIGVDVLGLITTGVAV